MYLPTYKYIIECWIYGEGRRQERSNNIERLEKTWDKWRERYGKCLMAMQITDTETGEVVKDYTP